MGKIYNVESFNLDHTKVEAPFVRLAGVIRGEHGDVITKFDLRFTQPNVEYMEMAAVHALEHLLAVNIREFLPNVIDLSPMGCQTGFYLTVLNLEDGQTGEKLVHEALAKTLEVILTSKEVPATSAVQCGNAASHSLAGAQKYAAQMLARRSKWNEIFAVEEE
jgi:S-ribosylhomocysteine lyase